LVPDAHEGEPRGRAPTTWAFDVDGTLIGSVLGDRLRPGAVELTRADDLRSTFARVAEELHHQYALGFSPAQLDGKMHDLTVRLSRPDLTTRARKRYMASRLMGAR